MILVDYNTPEKVVKYIELTNLTKFIIQRANSTGIYYSIYELNSSDSNKTAVEEFKKFSEIINENIAYKIILFDFCEQVIDDNGNLKIKKTRDKYNKNEATFCFSNIGTQNNLQSSQAENKGAFDYNSMRADIIKEISKAQEDNLVLNEIKNLKLKFEQFENEEEEEDTNISGNSDQLAQVMGLINLFKSQSSSKINGNDEIKININKALKILLKNDKQLDTDLLKLADISESNPKMFETLLTTLRNM